MLSSAPIWPIECEHLAHPVRYPMVPECPFEPVFGKIGNIDVHVANDVLPIRGRNGARMFDAFDRCLEGTSPSLPTGYQTHRQIQVGMGPACLNGVTKLNQRQRNFVFDDKTSRELHEEQLNARHGPKYGPVEYLVEFDSFHRGLATRKVVRQSFPCAVMRLRERAIAGSANLRTEVQLLRCCASDSRKRASIHSRIDWALLRHIWIQSVKIGSLNPVLSRVGASGCADPALTLPWGHLLRLTR